MADKPARTSSHPVTPVLDRMHADHDCDGRIVTHSQLIGSFLDWLDYQGIKLAKYAEKPVEVELTDGLTADAKDILLPTFEGFNAILHRYFEIDQNEEEAEKMALLQHVREGLAAALPESPSEQRAAHGDA